MCLASQSMTVVWHGSEAHSAMWRAADSMSACVSGACFRICQVFYREQAARMYDPLALGIGEFASAVAPVHGVKQGHNNMA